MHIPIRRPPPNHHRRRRPQQIHEWYKWRRKPWKIYSDTRYYPPIASWWPYSNDHCYCMKIKMAVPLALSRTITVSKRIPRMEANWRKNRNRKSQIMKIAMSHKEPYHHEYCYCGDMKKWSRNVTICSCDTISHGHCPMTFPHCHLLVVAVTAMATRKPHRPSIWTYRRLPHYVPVAPCYGPSPRGKPISYHCWSTSWVTPRRPFVMSRHMNCERYCTCIPRWYMLWRGKCSNSYIDRTCR